MCPTCDEFDTKVDISGPAQLVRIVGKIQVAVKDGKLKAVEGENPTFSNLNLSQTIPDILDYKFQCPACSASYQLFCESFRGSGGYWARN